MRKLLVVLALLMFALPAMAQDHAYQYKGTGYFGDYNPCCGEWVFGEVDFHVVANKNTYHVVFDGVLTGESSGATYKVKAVEKELYQWSANGAFIEFVNIKARFTNADGCGFIIYYRIHYVMNANGDIVVDTTEYTIECEDGTIY